jgi:hypothetical protein
MTMMRSFFDAFRRTADGCWVCIEPATLQGPRGRIEVAPGSVFSHGTMVMGLDLAQFLDVEDFIRAETASSLARSRRGSHARAAAGRSGAFASATA